MIYFEDRESPKPALCELRHLWAHGGCIAGIVLHSLPLSRESDAFRCRRNAPIPLGGSNSPDLHIIVPEFL